LRRDAGGPSTYPCGSQPVAAAATAVGVAAAHAGRNRRHRSLRARARCLRRPPGLLLGLWFVDGRGRLIRAGGKVVKNVAGYDMTRLIAGSAGTLGVITQVTLKTATRPERCAAISAEGPLDACANLALEVLGFQHRSGFRDGRTRRARHRLAAAPRIRRFSDTVDSSFPGPGPFLGRPAWQTSPSRTMICWKGFRGYIRPGGGVSVRHPNNYRRRLYGFRGQRPATACFCGRSARRFRLRQDHRRRSGDRRWGLVGTQPLCRPQRRACGFGKKHRMSSKKTSTCSARPARNGRSCTGSRTFWTLSIYFRPVGCRPDLGGRFKNNL